MIQYGYFLISIMLFIPWFMIYFSRRDLRKKMYRSGIYGAIMGFVSEYWYYYDYWDPPLLLGKTFPIEDFLFGFLYFGLLLTLYDFFIQKRDDKKFKDNKVLLFLMFVLSVLFMDFFVIYLRINSIIVSILLFFINSIIIIVIRPDLLLLSILSGIFSLLIIVPIYILIFIYFLPDFWRNSLILKNNMNYIFETIPISELLWYFATGAFGGIVYNFKNGLMKTNF